jgi:hypothetical protein
MPANAIKKADVEIGKTYAAKVGDRVVHVRIDAAKDEGGWTATNLETQRTVQIKTAARLRREITPESSQQLAAKVNGEQTKPEPKPKPKAKAKPESKPATPRKREPLTLPEGETPAKLVLRFVTERASAAPDAGGQGRPFITHTGKLVIHAKWLREWLAQTLKTDVTVSQATTILRDDLGYAERSVKVLGAPTPNLSVWVTDAPRGTSSIERQAAPERKQRAKQEAKS